MRALRILLVPVVAATIGGLIGAGDAVAAPADCHRIDARGTGQDLGDGKTRADIRGAGLLTGSTEGHFVVTPILGTTMLELDGDVVFTTNDSTVTVSVTGTFDTDPDADPDTAIGEFFSSGKISGATGKLAGAEGTLTLDGTADLATGAFTERVTGLVCADLRR